MIIALWRRWTLDRRARWIALLAGVVVADAIVGGSLLAWELRLVREHW